MPRVPEPGEPAMYKLQEVRYSHLPAEPGAPYLLTADPWSFLHSELERRASGTRGEKGQRHRRARYYARLAEGFYTAAKRIELPTSATLAYYGMLNLAKSWVSLKGVELETQHEHHGATLPLGSEYVVSVQSYSANDVNIFHSFVECLCDSRPTKKQHDLDTVASHVPEIHEIAFSTGHLPGQKRKFLPVDVQIRVNATKTRVFTEVRYAKKHEARVRAAKFHSGARASYFKQLADEGDCRVFRSVGRKTLRTGNGGNWPTLYRNIQNEYAELNLAGILTRAGYRYYCDLEPGDYPHLAYGLLLAFYLGSVARYRPAEAEALLQSDRRPIVSEFMSLGPDQFLYQLVGLITERVCVVPMAKL